MKINCPICDSKSSKLTDYKYNIEIDYKYLGLKDIYICYECDFCFANPMPSDSLLTHYYDKIYRANGRPHEINQRKYHKSLHSFRNFSYLEYLNNHLDISKLEYVLDFGAGTGDLGFLLKKLNPNIKLFCVENDVKTLSILEKRGYENLNNLNTLKEKFDLIITLHSLEHLSSIGIFETFKKIGKKNSKLFFEVPNCPFQDGFIRRPYDSPHLMFFTTNSLLKIAKKLNFKIINLSLNSIEIEKDFIEMNYSKKINEKWNLNSKRKNSIKDFILFCTPKFILRYYESFKLFEEFKSQMIESNKYKNLNNRSCVRGIFDL